MENPRSTSPGSIMPPYPWLLTQSLATNALPSRLSALRKIGVPYPAGFENGPAQKDLAAQAKKIVANLRIGSISNAPPDSEIIGLIAYLQRLGTDIKTAPKTVEVQPAASRDRLQPQPQPLTDHDQERSQRPRRRRTLRRHLGLPLLRRLHRRAHLDLRQRKSLMDAMGALPLGR